MADSQVWKNPELRQAALTCGLKLPCDSGLDMSSIDENIKRVKTIIDADYRNILESSLDVLEKIKALKNKFNVAD